MKNRNWRNAESHFSDNALLGQKGNCSKLFYKIFSLKQLHLRNQ